LKVVHICAEIAPGGAAHSTLNLHHGLLDLGIESWILTGASRGIVKNCVALPDTNIEKESIQCLAEDLVWGNRTQLSNSHFSLDLSGRSIVNHPLIADADVVNLHWVADFLSSFNIAELASLRKPVVWTLHDMRPLTGGCHFSAGCARYQDECGNCPQLQYDYLNFTKRSLGAMSEAASLLQPFFVAPSNWMLQNIRNSRVSRELDSTCIAYGLETNLFQPGNLEEARKELGLTHSGKYILLASHSMIEKRKGAMQAIEVLEQLKTDPLLNDLIQSGDLRLLCCGRKSEDFMPQGWEIDHVGYVTSSNMAHVYQAANIMLFTSTDDNLPNVLLEAMACGLPIVGHAVGGALELLGGDYAGDCLFQIGDYLNGAQLMSKLLKDQGKIYQIENYFVQKIRDNYTLRQQAESYQQLYQKLISKLLMEKPTNIVFQKGESENFVIESYKYISSLNREIQACQREIFSYQHEIESLTQQLVASQNENKLLKKIEDDYKIITKSKVVRFAGMIGLCHKT